MEFDFGENWAEFSLRTLDGDRVAKARADFAVLFDGVELAGKTFLDIGFGQGLSLLNAAACGARVVGCDIDPICARVLRCNAAWFPEVSADGIPLIVGSILDAQTQKKIRCQVDDGYEIVHSWGVLHHTGDLHGALRVAANLVAPRGHLVVAIYNRHWSSPLWRRIKWLYCCLPVVGRRLVVLIFYPVIWAVKLVATRQNPLRQERGMHFYYDVVEWVGGYPYEYATAGQVQALVEDLRLELVRHRPPRVPTGCNEFVFRKT